MKGLSVKQRIAGSFVLIIAVILATSVLYYQRAVDNAARARHVQTYDLLGMTGAATLRALLNDHLLATYALTIEAQNAAAGRPAVTRGWRERFQAIDGNVDRNLTLYPLTITEKKDREATARFKAGLGDYRRLHVRLLELLDRRALAEANAFVSDELEPAWHQCRDELVAMMSFNRGAIVDHMQGIEQAAERNKLTAQVSLAGAVTLALVCGVLLYRSITRPLDATIAAMRRLGDGDLSSRLRLGRRDEFNAIELGFNNMVGALYMLVAQAQRSAHELGHSIGEVAAATRQQQAAVTDTAATTVQIGQTASDIASTSRELARTMTELSRKAEQAARLADSGHMGVLRIGEVMRQLTAAATLVTDKLTFLSERTSGISQMVAVMSGLAQQAERLALRVTAEGERAGPQGRGLIMLASDLRFLAQRAAAGATDLDRRIREAQTTVADGSQGMARFGEEMQRGNSEMMQIGALLQQIILQIQELAPRIKTVGEGMRAQSGGADQISLTLGQLGASSRQSAQALTHASEAVESVDAVAQALRAGVSRFRV